MQELKGQINAVEQKQKTSGTPINGTSSIVGRESPNNKPQNNKPQELPGAPVSVHIGGITSDLTLDNSAHASGEKIPEAVAPKPAQLPNLESSLEIYGFVMLDMGYQSRTNNPDWFDVNRPTKLPSFNGEFAPDGKTFFGVRQTRFGERSSFPTGLGELKTLFEFELFGTGVDAGQITFRLRHAYGELGQFGAGQTWSAFMDIDVYPNQLEY
jgi:outer membrane DcaP-like protein